MSCKRRAPGLPLVSPGHTSAPRTCARPSRRACRDGGPSSRRRGSPSVMVKLHNCDRDHDLITRHFSRTRQATTVIESRIGSRTCPEKLVKAIIRITAALLIPTGPLLAADEAKQLAPTQAEVSTGRTTKRPRFWKADGTEPRPLWSTSTAGLTGGDKNGTRRSISLPDKGISCAAINYRLTRRSPCRLSPMRPAPFSSCGRRPPTGTSTHSTSR
jgi:hypothetical protein